MPGIAGAWALDGSPLFAIEGDVFTLQIRSQSIGRRKKKASLCGRGLRGSYTQQGGRIGNQRMPPFM